MTGKPTILRTLILLMTALALAAPAHARDWLKAETAHFEIYSDGYRFETERWARKLEWFDQVLRVQYAGAQSAPEGKLVIYLLDSPGDVARLTGKKNINGIYIQASEGPFLVANRRPGYEKDRISGQATLFHEYAHHFMYRNFSAAYPAWYREGFAEYVSTVTFDADRHWTFGAPAHFRLKVLRKKDMPLETILLADVDSLKSKRRGTFYSWSWLLVHMLNAQPEDRAMLTRYLAQFNGNATPGQAAQAFGDIDVLEHRLKAYAQSDLPFRKSAQALGPPAKVTVTALTPARSRLIELRLARKAGYRPTQTLTALRQLSAAWPDNADILFEIARLEQKRAEAEQARDYSAALRTLDQLLARDPDYHRANVMKAQLAMAAAEIDRAGPRPDWNALRRGIIAAVAADPYDALAHTELFRSYLAERRRPPPDAYRAIDRAFRLQPESSRIRMVYAYALGLRGQYDEARGLTQMLISDPHRTAMGQRTLATLKRMEDARQSLPVPD